MLLNYLRVALRHLSSNKGLAFINIAGLALGMTGAILLLLNIQYNRSSDEFHTNKDRIYTVFNKGLLDGTMRSWSQTPAPLGPTLKKEFPEIETTTRLSFAGNGLAYKDKLIKAYGDFADSTFWQLFSFPLLLGDTHTALTAPHSIVLTEQLAHRLFGDENPMSKTILIDNLDPMTVTGIVKDIPNNTRFKFEYLLPWQYAITKGIDKGTWNNQNVTTYVLLTKDAPLAALNKKISDITIRHGKLETPVSNFLYPLLGRLQGGSPAESSIDNNTFLYLLAGIILVIACINFMNLNTARSQRRAKEVGVRKVIGANRPTLILQFIGEAVLFASIAGTIALLLVHWVLPTYNNLARVHPTMDWTSPKFWLAFVAFVLFTGILAGSYPAFYLSSFQPSKVLKGVISNSKALITPRKVLVVTQFVLAIFLINFTLAFRRQIQYVQGRPIGYTKERLLAVPTTDPLRRNYPALKNALLQSGAVSSVAETNNLITQSTTFVTGLKWTGMDPHINPGFELITSQQGYVKTNGLTLTDGRDIDVLSHPADTLACVINEATAKLMHVPQPLGMTLSDEGISWTIVGIVKDFVIDNPGQEVRPLIIRGEKNANYISIRLSEHKPVETSLRTAEAIVQQYNPGFPTEYRFADEDYDHKFQEERSSVYLLNSFSLVAIFISCMGLLGLSIYMAENRIREVGIRKVLGATAASITTLLAKEFVRLVLLAILLASPLAWISILAFFRKFSYHTTPSIGWLIISGTIALVIAIATISFHSIKAAIANPIKSLRTE